MRNIKYKIVMYMVFTLIGCLFLQGCGKGISTTSEESQPEVREYSKTVTDLQITPDYVPETNFIEITNTLCYYGQETIIEQKEDILYSCKFYSQTMDGQGEPTFILEVTEQVLAFHLSKDSSGEDILCILTLEEEKCVLSEYDGEGKLTKQFDITDENFIHMYVSEMLRCQNGSYVAYNTKTLFVFDNKGRVLNPVECPEGNFLGDVVLKDDIVYVAYSGEDINEAFLAKVDMKTGKLTKKVLIPRGTRLCQGREGELLIVGEKALYRFDRVTEEAEMVLDWGYYNIFPQRIYGVDYFEEDVRILSWDMGNGGKPIQLILLEKRSDEEIAEEQSNNIHEGEYDSEGKRIITLYDPWGIAVMLDQDVIDSFNSENTQYTLMVKSENPNVGAVLTAEESPDLLLELRWSMIENYQNNGYLEDLTPFMKKSDILPLDDIQESVIEGFTFDGGIYALPQYCSLSTMLCLESQIGDKRGWTVDEYLDWVEQNPDLRSTMGISRDFLLEDCLRGDMANYVDFESGTAEFTGADFKGLLSRLKKLEINREGERYRYGEEYTLEAPRIFDNMIHSVFQITELETVHGERLVNMGFPNEDGEPRVMLDCATNLSILSKSTCKEGAFAFIEHCLTYKYADWDPNYERQLWTSKSRLKEECEKSNIYHDSQVGAEGKMVDLEYEITDEQEAMVIDMLVGAKIETYEESIILEIIYEEVEPYFQEQKDLDTVCDIIQSRVSILLSERR